MGVAAKDVSSGVVGAEGVIKESLLKQLKGGWVKAGIAHREEGILKVSPRLPPSLREKFNRTPFW